MRYLRLFVGLCIVCPWVVAAEDPMEEVTTTGFRWVSYTLAINSHFLPVNPLYTFNRFASLAVDNSLGQLRVRGSEANHLGVSIDSYDVGNPVSEFNFTNLSCAGINSITLDPNAAAGHPAGNLNLSSAKTAATSWLSQFGSDETQRHQFTTALNSRHNLTLSFEQTEGYDIQGDGDLDGLETRVAHYHYAGDQQEITGRYSSIEQDYDQGRALTEQALIGTTGVLGRTTWRTSSSLTAVKWYESWNNNTRGIRTKLSTQTPLATHWNIDVDLVADQNASTVVNQYQRQAFYRTYIRINYARPIANWRLAFSKEYIQEREESGTRYSIDPTKLSLAYLIDNWTVYVDYATRTISFPSMTDRYGWGKAWRPNPNIRPERGSSMDVGVQWAYPSGQLQLTRFSSRLKDKITFGSHPSCASEDRWGCNYSQNSTRGRNRGTELTWAHNWHTTLATQVGWLNLNSEERTTQNDPFRRSLRRPDHKLTLQLTWRRGPWHLEAIGIHASDAADFGARHLPAYQTYDLVAARELSRHLTWSFAGFNILDEKYQQAHGYRTPPRQLNMGFQLTW